MDNVATTNASSETKSVSTRLPKIVREPVKAIFNHFEHLDVSSHGYVPFILWLFLFFGGIWFPATSFLRAFFEGREFPVTYWTPAPAKVVSQAAPAKESVTPLKASSEGGPTTKTEQSGSEQSEVRSANVIRAEVRQEIGPISVLICLVACGLFWSWTNLALLCVMASTMGEVNRNRCRSRSGAGGDMDAAQEPDFRLACTRAFVVYLIAIVNGIAFGGSLVPTIESGQTDYTRVAVLSCIASFLASYRPEFFEALLQRFSASTTTQPGQPRQRAVAKSTGVPSEETPDDEAAPLLSVQFEGPIADRNHSAANNGGTSVVKPNAQTIPAAT